MPWLKWRGTGTTQEPTAVGWLHYSGVVGKNYNAALHQDNEKEL